MKRKYTKTKHLLPEILELKSQGKTHREIAMLFGLTKDQVKKLVGRYNHAKRENLKETKDIVNLRDRLRKTPLTSRQKLERENNQLKMEVELLRSFLQAAGRR